LLDGRYRVIGIARVHGPGSVHGWYCTTDFGVVVNPSAPKPGESWEAHDAKDEPAPQPRQA